MKPKPKATDSHPTDAPAEAKQEGSLVPLLATPKAAHGDEPRLYIAADRSCVLDLGEVGLIEVCRGEDNNVVINLLINHDGNGVKVRSLDPATWGIKH